MPRTITLKETQTAYSTVIEQVQATGESLIVEQMGKPAVVVIPFAEYQRLVALHKGERKSAWQQEQQRILKQEQAVYQRMKPELLKTHMGKFVAINEGQLVDWDISKPTLAKRVYAKFGYHTILMTQVADSPRVYHARSPRLVRR